MIKVIVHPLFIVFIGLAILLGFAKLLFVYILTVILHEGAHAFVAHRLGYKLNQIKLMPYGASLCGRFNFFSVGHEVTIALAGPIVNFVLVILICALWWIEPIFYTFTQEFMVSNLVVGLTNCLPIFPLDGGRVLLGLLSIRFNRVKAANLVRCLGIVLSVIILVGFCITVFYIPNYTFLAFGSFLFVSSVLEDKSSFYTFNFLSSKQGLERGLVVRELAVPQSLPLFRLFTKVKRDCITNFCVMDENYAVLGKITEKQLERLIKIYPISTSLRQILLKKLT